MTPPESRGIPVDVLADGHRWRVERVWPDGPDRTTIEVRASRVAGVRSGVLSVAAAVGASYAAGGHGVALNALGHDPRLPALAETAADGTVVVHRAGRRAVVRRSASFTKVVRAGRAQGVREAHDRARAAGFARGFDLARAHSTPDEQARGIVHFSIVPGRTLYDLGADGSVPDAAVADAWRAWGDAWVRSVSSSTAADLPAHGADAEVRVVETWTAHAQRMLPERAAGIAAAAARVHAALTASEPDPLRISHRDLHDKQVLHDGGARLGLLDLDTAGQAEAALDLGNVRAHLAWRVAQGVLTPQRAETALTVVDAVAAELEVSPGRLAAYESATTLRLGCLYLFRPAWRRQAEEWLATIIDR